MPDDTMSQPRADRPTRRAVVYCLVLGVLAGVLMFWELGADSLTSDEAQYALVAQNIRAPGGSWIYVTPYPPTPYFQKPPLYFWLTAATYNLFGREEFAFRAWSATAGVGAVMLTCILGAMLFAPEVGALAALLLMLNRSFLLVHGARSGTFDAVVTFLVTAAALSYVLAFRGNRPWLAWIAVGGFLGLASITKPFVGVIPLVLFALHTITQRDKSIRWRLGGPAVALLVLVAVASPWFVAQHRKYDAFADEMLRQNIVERALIGVDDKHVQEPTFYLQQVSKTSWPFLLVIPAALHTLAGALRGDHRSIHALLALWGIGWIGLFSLSASKAVHYAYPAFPALAIMLAHAASRMVTIKGATPKAIVTAIVLTLSTFTYTRTLYSAIPAERSPYVPWEMHRILSPAIDARHARVILYGFPDTQTDWRSQMKLRARDCYYLIQMMRPAALRTRDPNELRTLLISQTPTLLILSKQADLETLLPQLNLGARTDDRFVYAHQGFLVLGLDFGELLSPSWHPGQTTSYVSDLTGASPGQYRVSVMPPVRGAGRISIRFRLDAPADEVRFAFVLEGGSVDRKRLEDHVVRPVNGVIEVSANIEEELWAGNAPHTVTLSLRRLDSSLEALSGAVEEVRLTMLPNLPPESHPRR